MRSSQRVVHGQRWRAEDDELQRLTGIGDQAVRHAGRDHGHAARPQPMRVLVQGDGAGPAQQVIDLIIAHMQMLVAARDLYYMHVGDPSLSPSNDTLHLAERAIQGGRFITLENQRFLFRPGQRSDSRGHRRQRLRIGQPMIVAGNDQ